MNIDPKTEIELVGKLLGSEPANELFKPVTHEIGQLLGDLGNIVGFYSRENLKKIFTKWARNREKTESKGHTKTIDAIEFERIMPLLPTASLQSDEELQERWAALLESAANADTDYLPSFGQTLAQLTAEEAQFLDRLWKYISQPMTYAASVAPEAEQFNENTLLQIYDRELHAKMDRKEWQPNEIHSVLEQHVRVQHFRLLIDDLARLGIINQLNPGEAIVTEKGPVLHVNRYALTRYGLNFIRSVS